MHKIILFLVAISITIVTSAQAGEIDSGAVVGGAVGGGAGAAVGSAVGGREGAIIGGALGGALGAGIGASENQSKQTRVVEKEVVHVHEVHDYDKRHDNGRHLGHYKQKHKHRHKHK
jgi:outer membrane lipoprotein SlyB